MPVVLLHRSAILVVPRSAIQVVPHPRVLLLPRLAIPALLPVAPRFRWARLVYPMALLPALALPLALLPALRPRVSNHSLQSRPSSARRTLVRVQVALPLSALRRWPPRTTPALP